MKADDFVEYLTIAIFCVFLLICLITDISILYALAAGLLLFMAYSIKKGYSLRNTVGFALEGVKTVKNILLTFVLIGAMTALWREAGTIASLTCYAAKLIHPSIFVLMVFLLNCLISFLTGTSFGTAATIGVICSTMAASLDISTAVTGGAVLAGAFFGDRCSPVSTSALLVSEVTKTNLFENIKRMLRTAAVPFLISCAAYAVIGLTLNSDGAVPDLGAAFGAEFELSVITVLPAVVLLALALLRVNVKLAMAASIVTALPICIFLQDTAVLELTRIMVFGYTSENAEISNMLAGGGIVSMLNVAAIVCISSAYSGIFYETGLLNGIKSVVGKLSEQTFPYFATLVTATVTGMIGCNQTLPIMLTQNLCGEAEPDNEHLALYLEDSAVIVAPLIPWSIASAVPLTTIEAPVSSILFAFFLYLLPVCNIIIMAVRKRLAKGKCRI